MHKHSVIPMAQVAQPAPYASAGVGAELRDRLALLDFLQMMREEGTDLNLRRFQLDPGYAQQCLARADQSGNAMLRIAARRLSASFLLDS